MLDVRAFLAFRQSPALAERVICPWDTCEAEPVARSGDHRYLHKFREITQCLVATIDAVSLPAVG
jgi:hypothetical protein